ncbi:hypothetical protein [Paenibacillus sp. FSL L8-0708]|uniref:hypothetical protein n=1 Tax=Paenibacillus sp. FSL L8-0708 TaxID=2975311 RepID=UPI0030FBAE92
MKEEPGEKTVTEAQDTPKVENKDSKEGSNTPDTEPTAPPTVETKPQKESVVLRGWDEGREGSHAVHLKEGIFTFINGKADFSPEAAEALRLAGYVE